MTAIAYEVAPGLDLSDLQKSLASLNIKSEVRSDTAPEFPKTLVFNDPDGLQIELFSRWDFCKPVEPIRGLAVAKLGHVALYTPDPERAAKFFGDLLGFRVSDRIEENFVFLRCGPEHHAMNFARGAEARIHHLAFELRSCSTPLISRPTFRSRAIAADRSPNTLKHNMITKIASALWGITGSIPVSRTSITALQRRFSNPVTGRVT